MKIKLKSSGLRIVYKLERKDDLVLVIIIGARADSKVYKEAEKRIDTNELNKTINNEMLQRPPRFPKNKICKMYYITQVDINAPTFLAFVNKKERANFSF